MFELEGKREELLEKIEEYIARKRYADLRDLLLPMEAADIAKEALAIAADICVYTNHNIKVEVLE